MVTNSHTINNVCLRYPKYDSDQLMVLTVIWGEKYKGDVRYLM